MLRTTGEHVIAAEGLTTQHRVVLAARRREKAEGGMSVGDRAR